MKTSSSEYRLLLRLENVNAFFGQPIASRFLRLRNVILGNHMQSIAEERHSPTLGTFFQEIRCPLRPVYCEFEQVAPLFSFNAARRAFRNKFPGHHKTQTVALLGFLQIVRCNKDGRTPVGQIVDHAPECAAGERIHT